MQLSVILLIRDRLELSKVFNGSETFGTSQIVRHETAKEMRVWPLGLSLQVQGC